MPDPYDWSGECSGCPCLESTGECCYPPEDSTGFEHPHGVNEDADTEGSIE